LFEVFYFLSILSKN